MDLKIFMLDLMHVVNLTFSEQNYHSNMTTTKQSITVVLNYG